MSEKIISIIIPCYNVEKYIRRCLKSIVDQTLGMDKMELIFVNDASTDGTLEILQEYEQQYPESIMVINLENNVGQGAARNIAMQYASAEYLGFVDSDDFVDSSMFEEMVNIITKHNCDFVECDWDFFSADEKERTKNSFEITVNGYLDFSDDKIKEEYIVEQLFFTSMCTKIFRRRFLLENEIKCVEGLKYEDMYFCFLVFLYAKSYYHVNRFYYHYFLNPNGTVQQRKSEHQFDMMDVALSFLCSCKERGLYHHYKDVVEWMFLEKYYVYLLWDIWDVYKEQSYDCYVQLKESVKQLVPDYKTNPYRRLDCNQLDDFLLKLVDISLDKTQFNEIMKKLKEQQKNTR